MEEFRVRVKLSEDEEERIKYLKEVFGINTNAKLLRKLLKLKF